MTYDTGGLSEPSATILECLRGIHPGLGATRSRYALDQTTGRVRESDGVPVERPRYWITIDHRGKQSLLFAVESPDGEYQPLDMRVVRRIGTDLGIASETCESMWAKLEAAEKAENQAFDAAKKDRFRRFIEENSSAWKRAVENARNGVPEIAAAKRKMRDPILYSYDNQPIYSSTPMSVPKTAKERGIYTGE